jgi:hypothetical protein
VRCDRSGERLGPNEGSESLRSIWSSELLSSPISLIPVLRCGAKFTEFFLARCSDIVTSAVNYFIRTYQREAEDLTDCWRGFTHLKGPHHDTVSTGERCLTQHNPQYCHIVAPTGTATKKKAKETLASGPNWWLKRIHSLEGASSRYSKHRRTVSNPAQTTVIPYCSSYWNSNKEEG